MRETSGAWVHQGPRGACLGEQARTSFPQHMGCPACRPAAPENPAVVARMVGPCTSSSVAAAESLHMYSGACQLACICLHRQCLSALSSHENATSIYVRRGNDPDITLSPTLLQLSALPLLMHNFISDTFNTRQTHLFTCDIDRQIIWGDWKRAGL